MAKPSKYITFDLVGSTGKTDVINILSISSQFILGQIRWYGPWRQYCFMPSGNSVFNRTCMSEIIAKINELMDERRRVSVRIKAERDLHETKEKETDTPSKD